MRLGALLFAATASVAASCESDLDCSLNGICTFDKTCDCDAAWEGTQCERFATLPTPFDADIKEPNVTTWGGGSLQHKVKGEFNMYVSEYVGNCGITSYQTNSQVVRFTSPLPTGPWTRKELVLPTQSTCPSAAISPNGTVVLWTLGAGGGPRPKTGADRWGKKCVGGASPCGFAKHGCGPDAPPPLHPTPDDAKEDEAELRRRPGRDKWITLDDSPEGGLQMMVSDSVSGPWRHFSAAVKEPVVGGLSAPWILENGTTFWVVQSPLRLAPWIPQKLPGGQELSGTVGTILRADSWEGPYEVLSRGACAIGEDHSMYIDSRGHFHCITHRFSIPGDKKCDEPGGCTVFDATRDGGHAFSIDGRHDTWFCADGKGGHAYCTPDMPPAYNSTIVYEDGIHRFGTRERPHLIFDNGQPVALTTSVQHCQAPGVPDLCTPGDPHSCNASNRLCHNNWPGYMDRSWTSITPLKTSKPTKKSDALYM